MSIECIWSFIRNRCDNLKSNAFHGSNLRVESRLNLTYTFLLHFVLFSHLNNYLNNYSELKQGFSKMQPYYPCISKFRVFIITLLFFMKIEMHSSF